MSDVATKIIVRGKVQGVFFRTSTQEEAQELRLAGWVRNHPDGSVEIHAEGSKTRVEELIEWCHDGPPSARVTSVNVEWVPPKNLQSFQIRY